MKKMKDNISESDFKLLMNHLRGDENIRELRKERLVKLFTLLYYLGIRINECSQLTYESVIELIEVGKIKIIAHKQKMEKEVLLGESGKVSLKKLFAAADDTGLIFVSERGSKTSTLEPQSLIRDANTYLKVVFPDKNITSHSFRQTLITRLSELGVNVKVIQEIVSHKSISSTYGYIKVDEDTKLNALNAL